MIKLNIGCASRPLKDYINIDMDNLATLKKRYPGTKFDENLKIENFDIFNLPYESFSVDEIRADGLIEHLSFLEEPKFFTEVSRVLKKNGILKLTTIDFEKLAKQWLEAPDDWKDFFRNDEKSIEESHWFGTYTYSPINRWGYLTASIFGSQNGEGQFHKNCYTKKKFEAICKKINFKILELNEKKWKGDRDHIIELIATKL